MELLKLAKNIKDVLSVSICRMKVIAKTEQPIITVSDIVTGISSAHTEKMKPPMHLHYKNISLYMVYDRYKKKRLGRCYAVKIGERYYGGLVGDDSIFICSKDNFIFRKTDKVSVPLKKTESEEFTLFCSLDINKGCMQPLYIVKTCNQESDKRVEVVRFTADYPLDQAIRYCAEEGFL